MEGEPMTTTEAPAHNPDAAAVYMENGIAVYRASSLMSCQNMLLMARLGYQGSSPPEHMQKRFDAGHYHEPLILAAYEAKGTTVYNRQGSVDLPIGSKALVRGHIDGMAAGQIYVDSINGRRLEEGTIMEVDGLVIVDAKALAQSGFDKWKKNQWRDFPYYEWQQFIYALGYDAKGIVMAVKNKNTDEHVFDYWEMSAMALSKADIVKRVMMIEKLADQGESALFESKCDPVSYPCPFFMFHQDEEKVTIKDGEVEGGFDRLEEIAVRRGEIDSLLKDLNSERDDLDEEIRNLYGQREASARLSVGTVTVYRSSYTGFDWDALSADTETDIDDLKGKYNRKLVSPKLSVRITKKKGN